MMQAQKSNWLNAGAFGDQTPWFGPIFADYRCLYSTPNLQLEDGIDYDLVAMVWDLDGNFVGEKVMGSYRRDDIVDIELVQFFPEMAARDGTVAFLFHAKGQLTPFSMTTWCVRLVTEDGRTANIVGSTNPRNLNYPERTGRESKYRMCSQELIAGDPDWKAMSWHANVSADPSWQQEMTLSLTVYNAQGEGLAADPFVLKPFGSVMLDLEAVFGTRLADHLASSNGRGSYVMKSENGGGIGYHFLQNKKNGDLAMDHTRPILIYLNQGYGAERGPENPGIKDYLRSAATVLKFRFGNQ